MRQQEKEYNEKAFAASLKGVKMDPWQEPGESAETNEERFARIKKEASIRAKKANGELSEDYEQNQSTGLDGFGYESEDD